MGVRVAAAVATVLLAVGLAACGSSQPAAVVRTRDPGVNDATETSSPPTTENGTFDLLGGQPQSISIDHTGDYVWTSDAVLPALPDSFDIGYKPVDAQVSGFHDTLVAVAGGYSLRVTFTADSFSQGAAVNITDATARGTPHLIVPGGQP